MEVTLTPSASTPNWLAIARENARRCGSRKESWSKPMSCNTPRTSTFANIVGALDGAGVAVGASVGANDGDGDGDGDGARLGAEVGDGVSQRLSTQRPLRQSTPSLHCLSLPQGAHPDASPPPQSTSDSPLSSKPSLHDAGVGETVGASVGANDGDGDGDGDGARLGAEVGVNVGTFVDSSVSTSVVAGVGSAVGA